MLIGSSKKAPVSSGATEAYKLQQARYTQEAVDRDERKAAERAAKDEAKAKEKEDKAAAKEKLKQSKGGVNVVKRRIPFNFEAVSWSYSLMSLKEIKADGKGGRVGKT